MKSITQRIPLAQLAKPGLMLIIVAAVTLGATSLIQYFYSLKGIREEAMMRAENQLGTTRVQIMDVVNQAEAAVRNSMWIARWCLDVPDSLQVVARRVVEDNPVVMGSTVALVPGYYSQHPLFAPYACRKGEVIEMKTLATPQYDYPSQEWFAKPLELGESYWSEPYIDEGGGNILMTTYSVPLKDYRGQTAAVLTADVSLEWLSQLVNSMQVYDNAYGVVLSRQGKVMVGPDETQNKETKVQEYTTHVERTGWTISIVIPEDEIYGDIRRIVALVTIMQLLGIGMIILILRTVAKNQQKYNEINEKKAAIESELHIASAIQKGMLPKNFPTSSNRDDVLLHATLMPAKDVGGDLFDFYIRDEKLFFCIGDVSGKGVPASLVMAVTRAIFRTVSARESMPDRIMTTMNKTMADMNESNMFVTLFVGVLDLPTGRMRYCNAGHDAPLLVGVGVGTLPCDSNIPVGIMSSWKYTLQEKQVFPGTTIFLFTDGLTEAENASHEQFMMQRVNDVATQALSEQKQDPKQLINLLTDAVHQFVGDAEQSDDLTMMAIQYTKQQRDVRMCKSITLPNDTQEVPRLAAFVDEVCEAIGFSPAVTMQMNLALEEAVVNVMKYAYPIGTHGNVTIEAQANDVRLKFTIIDSGKPFDPTVKADVDLSLPVQERPIGGLGIHIIRQIMDSINYERLDGHNVLTLRKRL
ncbi:MAG: SpoIIE family protein phosphatase [Bacteroidaceae bacterium]|nr:SpoIIE family protein phosphatase [Bacteroidaceae bacterium]